MGILQGKQMDKMKASADSHDECPWDENRYSFDWDCYPELVSHILLCVPDRDLLNSCRLVCKSWTETVDSKYFWRKRAQHRGCVIPHKMTSTLPLVCYQSIAMKNPFGRNLIVNPYGRDALHGWHPVTEDIRRIIDGRLGAGFKVEDPPDGANPLVTVDELKDVATSCWATTYYLCRKCQLIDLYSEGCSAELMSAVKPAIYICDWYAARFDCSSVYSLTVTLFDKDHVEIDRFHFDHEEPQWTGMRWSKVEHTFINTEDVKFVCFVHEGKDTLFWAGHYGSKMTGSTIQLRCE